MWVADDLARRFGLPYLQFPMTATDANRFALRLCREITRRCYVLVFNHCYHGTVDEAIQDFTFEACSDFTRVTARWIAQPPKATFVTRLRDGQLPNRPARQLPDQPTTLWVVPSSTGVPRRRRALSGVG